MKIGQNIIKTCFLFLLMTITSIHSYGQLQPEAMKYRTGFYNNYYTNPDSAIFYARKLAINVKSLPFLRQAIHEDIFTHFLDETKQKFKDNALKNKAFEWSEKKYSDYLAPIYSTLYKMSIDSNQELVNASRPIILWINVHNILCGDGILIQPNILQEYNVKSLLNENTGRPTDGFIDEQQNVIRAKKIVKLFLENEFSQKDLYQNKTGTYALLIYKDIMSNKNLQKEANDLLSGIMKKSLFTRQDINVYTASRLVLNKRAWDRYIYAAANYYKGISLVNSGNYKAATIYYKTAAEYSPDLTDQGLSGEIFNELYLFGDRNNEKFQLTYIEHLENYGDKESMLAALKQIAIRFPIDYKPRLQSYYIANFASREGFNVFWRKAINQDLAKAPIIIIKKIDAQIYSLAANVGKWILVDFWGTWCAPCREEHPQLEELYVKSKSVQSVNLDIITIACHDTKEKVDGYMAEFKYTYPVAIDDLKLTKEYNVLGYPTKALITPEGNYLIIPFSINWVKFIETYIEN